MAGMTVGGEAAIIVLQPVTYNLQLAQFVPNHLHQGFQRLWREIELDVGRCEQLRNRTAAAKAFGLEQVVDGLLRILLEVCPDLQSANLCNAVFNIVERAFEQMKLLLPQIPADGFKSSVIHTGIVTVHNFAPDVAAVFGGMRREVVQTMLEAVDACDPREQPNHVGEFAFGTADDRFVVIAIERLQIRHTDEFHAHAGDFGKFGRNIAVGKYRLVCKRKLMEGMSGFME